MRVSPEVCGRAQALIASRLGLEFPDARTADLERGLLRACQVSAARSLEEYLAWLAVLPGEDQEWRRLAGRLTVGETYFFRDRAAFEALGQRVLPSLIATRRAEGLLRIRLWSAGCATGEEPYSLAILLDPLLSDLSDWAVTIMATDINLEALETAQQGRYREWSLRDTPPWIRDRYFHRLDAATFELDPRIRRMVTFAPLNLAEDGYPSVLTNTTSVDLIVCRNVLMYFTREAQRAVLARLRQALLPGGFLMVSPVEASAELLHPLQPANFPGAILYRKELTTGQGSGASDRIPDCTLRIADWERKEDGIADCRLHTAGWAVAELHPKFEISNLQSAIEQPPSPCPPAPLLSAPSLADPESLSPSPQSPIPARSAAGGPSPQSLLEQARELADRGNLEEARGLCEAALAQDRLDPETHILLAAICQETGEIPAALEALRRALYLDPDSAAANFLLGTLLLRMGEPGKGQRCLETVVGLLSPMPRDEPVHRGDGLTVGRLLEIARSHLEISGRRPGAIPQAATSDPSDKSERRLSAQRSS